MNTDFAPSSAPESLRTQASGDEAAPDSGFTVWSASTYTTCSASSFRWLHPRLAAYVAFFATVFASMAAVATVASHDVTLLLGGF